jgi:hypothetical protein
LPFFISFIANIARKRPELNRGKTKGAASYSDPAIYLRVPKDEEQTCHVFDLAGKCRLSAISRKTQMTTGGQKPAQSISSTLRAAIHCRQAMRASPRGIPNIRTLLS